MQKHLDITVTGFVQGVFFRQSAKTKAEELNVAGFVKNMPDGSIYIEAESNENALEGFVSWCWEGPLAARVANVCVVESPLRSFSEFRVE